MTVMLPGRPVSKFRYVLRALLAAVLIVAFAVWMVGRSAGWSADEAEVYTDVPVGVGLLQEGAPVRFHGIKVGRISSIEAGATSSRVTLALADSAIGQIPGRVTARVLPRTFFGDVYLQLIPTEGSQQSTDRLSAGDQIAIDDGPDAVNLYDVFAKLSHLIEEVQPQEMTIALTAVSKAVSGRGDQLGMMIDDWWAASKELEQSVTRFIEATPQFREVAESLERATPAVIETMASVTSISRGIVDHRDHLADFFRSAVDFVSATGSFVAQQRRSLITVLDATGTILSTVAENPQGVSQTVAEAEKFGKAGAILFSTGRFNITTVATFSQPMPYTAADCPTYGSLRGAHCTGRGAEYGVGPVRKPGEGPGRVLDPPKRTVAPASTGPEIVGGAAEAQPLGLLEGSVAPSRTRQSGTPNPATTLMLGPMVRGTEVTVR
ncbi:MCE family protein [Gordonia hydrophobica]|uniref:MCE family protein n=1 Tax=Gordonia hydrophobica TaxID=40516 RepID=A0ABZ2U2R3_9ACTN|nr:MCE family protein [Gordonia hydrophobica]MBM7367280.1 virulence factor Mce-like protein [Gordonia hydrophobica]